MVPVASKAASKVELLTRKCNPGLFQMHPPPHTLNVSLDCGMKVPGPVATQLLGAHEKSTETSDSSRMLLD